MAADPKASAAQCALSRFGLGPRPGDRRRIASDPRGAVEAEVASGRNALDTALPEAREIAAMVIAGRMTKRLERGDALQPRQEKTLAALRERGLIPPEGAKTDAADPADAPAAAMDGKARRRRVTELDRRANPRLIYDGEVAARFQSGRAADIGYLERLTHFWANHFAVSTSANGYVLALAGAYEREAIRPHILGRFSELAIAATRHPAMLRYLDNATSVGPESRFGERARKGLNENHARELMELHTVGVQGGYTQADVVELAKALTGWTLVPDADEIGRGAFAFNERRHEPGARTVLGKRYAEGGVEQAEKIIADLARHPATARRVARKLAVAFVADEPPQTLVERLAKAFTDTEGDLREVSLALARADEAWDAPRAKMRSPQEFAFACARAFVGKPRMGILYKGLETLGQRLWRPPSPEGYTLAGSEWIAPDAQTNRLDLAADLAEGQASGVDPNDLAEDLIGDVMSDETRTAVKRAGSREQALALLLMSPEMQRR